MVGLIGFKWCNIIICIVKFVYQYADQLKAFKRG